MTFQQFATDVVTYWTVVTAVASIGYSLADKTGRGHAFLSALAATGIDLPKLLDALYRLFVAESGGGGGGAVATVTPSAQPAAVPLAAPVTRLSLLPRLGARFAIAAALSVPVGLMGVAVAGCATLATVVTPQGIATLIQYLDTAVSLAQALWAAIVKLLPADVQSTASDEFNKALLDVQNARAVLVDAQQALPGDGGTLDSAAAVKAAQEAFAEISAVIERYSATGSSDAGAALVGAMGSPELGEFRHQAAVIAGWRK